MKLSHPRPAVLALLLLSQSSLAMGAPPPAGGASAPAEASFPLFLSSNRALAILRIGGHPPVPVVFDTGTDDNILDQAYADSLGLKPSGSSTLTDAATGASVTVPVVTLGRASFGGVDSDALHAQTTRYDVVDEVGVFGPNSFAGKLVYLEIGQNRVRIRDRDSSAVPRGTPQPYVHGLPAIMVDVAGHKLIAQLDSGNTGALSLPLALASKLPLMAPPVLVGIASSISGEQKSYRARLRGIVRVGPVTLENPQLDFLDRGRSGGDGAGGNVGLPIMRRLTVILDPQSRRSWVVAPHRLSREELGEFAGGYGHRNLSIANGRLVYRLQGREPAPLAFLGEDMFENPATGDRLQFWRHGGKVAGFDLIAQDGRIAGIARTG